MARRHVVRWSRRSVALASLAACLLSALRTVFIHDTAGAAIGVSCGAIFWSRCDLPPNHIFVPGPVIYSHPPRRLWMNERVGSWRWLPEWVDWPNVSIVSLPLWIPVLVAAVPDLVVPVRTWRRASACRCRSCGYDRHGLGTAVRCPECGEAPDGPTPSGQERPHPGDGPPRL